MNMKGPVLARPTPPYVFGSVGPEYVAPRSGRKFLIYIYIIKIINKISCLSINLQYWNLPLPQ